jgi:K+-sensing histidine kinase KdpD
MAVNGGDNPMKLVKGVIPFAVTLVVVAAVTGILFVGKQAHVGPHHPVFVYLLPVALVAIAYGTLPAALCAIAAAMCSAYFLYDPIYSFHVSNRLEYGDLICFTGLALIGVKCTVELTRPTGKMPAAKPRFGRP